MRGWRLRLNKDRSSLKQLLCDSDCCKIAVTFIDGVLIRPHHRQEDPMKAKVADGTPTISFSGHCTYLSASSSVLFWGYESGI